MNTLAFTGAVAIVSFAAGFLGSLTGLGGGVVIVPMLTLAFGVDIRYAIGASLVSVIATSSGAAAAYVREGFTNIRIGMLLEIATTLGAIGGAALTGWLPTAVIGFVFGLALLQSAFFSLQKKDDTTASHKPADPLGTALRLNGEYPGRNGTVYYSVRRVPAGFGLMGLAGVMSGLLGIGSGALKVIAMDQVMGLLFKVSTTTSNFMIGVTAAASAGIYLSRGNIDPGLAMPVMLGVLAGSFSGARMLAAARSHTLRIIFSAVVLVLAFEMIYNSATGRL